ncbi:MAG: hypothetical protein U9Q98_09870 [Bacteroidota bacterium]|nr:hypothetical protein [Bacteroidota bacterium]
MSKKYIHSFFDHTEHPDESTLWLYSQGELTRKDMHRVEQHLIDCPMCSDVVDGFSMYESESSLNASKNRASLMFEQALSKRKKRKILYLSMVAVFVVVAVSAVVLVYDFSDKSTQKNSKLAKYIPREDSGKLFGEDGFIIKKDTGIGNIALNRQKEEKPSLKPEKKETTAMLDEELVDAEQETEESEPVIKELNVPDDRTNEKEIDTADMSLGTIAEDHQQDSMVIAGIVRASESHAKDAAFAEMEVKEETVHLANRTELDFESDEGIRQDENSDLDIMAEQDDRSSRKGQKSSETVVSKASVDALQMSDSKVLEENPLYQQGVEAKNAGKLSKAIRLFSRVPKGDSSYWNAQWQIATIHRTKGDTVKAVKVYSILKDTSNPHQYSARFFYDLLNTEDQ